ncbi:unnamed protein product [Cuscuta epithymum]|uniref:PDZ domain-containing protein n=1 Tax=Cuscuta epithymum TaxID=186058 RepID=A0AAV0EML2_9ASTE|nr:unnamed protein product [Cuscuta epithymum]
MPKRKMKESLWERYINPASYTEDDHIYATSIGLKHPKFHKLGNNLYLDINTKIAALRASPSLVSLITHLDGKESFQCSGTIIEVENDKGIIITSADCFQVHSDSTMSHPTIKVEVCMSDGTKLDGKVLAYDFHYNLAAVEVHSGTPLKAAKMALFDDAISVDTAPVISTPILRAHSVPPLDSHYTLIPGNTVIALGRYFAKPYALMAAPGQFSINQVELECQELFRATCSITRCGAGGPLVNSQGEFIGVCFYDMSCTPFLPITLTLKWWEQFKKNGEIQRPLLSMELTNLYAVSLDILETVVQNDTFHGVMVEKVLAGSTADVAGIRPNDVITRFAGGSVRSILELVRVMWDNIGKSVEVTVLRTFDGTRLNLNMVVDVVTQDELYCWPVLDKAR